MKKTFSKIGLAVILETVLLAILTTVLLVGCGHKKENDTGKTPKIIPVKVQTIGFSDEVNSRNYVGTVEESFALSLSFSTGGTVKRVLVSEGQRVSKGQLLAELSSAISQNAYDVAKSTLKQAQDAYDRMKPLYEKGSLPEIKFVEVETGWEQAKAMEAIARKNLEDCKVYAPFNGIIARRSIEEGQEVMMGAPAFKIVSIDEVDVNVSIPEGEISSIKTGQPAVVKVSALADKEYRGVVDKKGVEANPISHTYTIKIRIKNQQSELMPGMVCKVFVTPGTVDRNIVIPNKSVQILPGGKRFVWLADGDVATRRFITVGSLTNYGVTVVEGLADGDKLIVEGGNKISEGMKISIIQ